MRPAHALLAVLVAAVWGVNFSVIDIGLDHFPPLFFSGLRFLAAAVPAVFLVGRPDVPWRWILGVGLALGVAKFGLLFVGMDVGIPAGLASLVLQAQVVFTVVFAVALLGERVRPVAVAGLVVACGGLVVAGVAEARGGTVGGFVLVVAAAASWGVANIWTRLAAPRSVLSWMVWVSLVPPLPLFALSVALEGPTAGVEALLTVGPVAIGAVLFVAWIATVLGFGAWGFLLGRHDTATVVPFALLVPVFGMTFAVLLRGERITAATVVAAVLLLGGVALAVLGGRPPAGGQPPTLKTKKSNHAWPQAHSARASGDVRAAGAPSAHTPSTADNARATRTSPPVAHDGTTQADGP